MRSSPSEIIFNALESFRIRFPPGHLPAPGRDSGKFIQPAATSIQEKFSDAASAPPSHCTPAGIFPAELPASHAFRNTDDNRDKVFSEAQTILKVYPQVRLIMPICAPALPGAAEAISQTLAKTSSIGKAYIHSGVVQEIALWNTTDLGYLVVAAGTQLAQGGL